MGISRGIVTPEGASEVDTVRETVRVFVCSLCGRESFYEPLTDRFSHLTTSGCPASEVKRVLAISSRLSQVVQA